MEYHNNFKKFEEYESISSNTESFSDNSLSNISSKESSDEHSSFEDERKVKRLHSEYRHSRPSRPEENYHREKLKHEDSHKRKKKRKHRSRHRSHRQLGSYHSGAEGEMQERQSSHHRSRSGHKHKRRKHHSETRHKRRLKHKEESYESEMVYNRSSSRHVKRHKRHKEKRSKSRRRRRERSPSHDNESPVKVKDEPLSEPERSRRFSSSSDSSSPSQKKTDQFSENKIKRSISLSITSSDEEFRPTNKTEAPNIIKTEDNQENGSQQREISDRISDSETREQWGSSSNNKEEETAPTEKKKVDMGLSGKLTEDANTFNGVVIKYVQPPEARKPKRRWRWYIFKGDEELPFLPLHRQSAYLIGRDRKVCDIPTDHPSCSKQHSVMQYRLVPFIKSNGTTGKTVKPFLIDLDSANGTFINNKPIEKRRYYELLEKDVVKFGFSSREYILLHEGSKDDDVAEADLGVSNDMSPVSLLRSK